MQRKPRKAAVLARHKIETDSDIPPKPLAAEDSLEERVDAAIAEAREEKYARNTVCARAKVGKDFDGWLAGRPLSIGLIKEFLLDSSHSGYRATTLFTRKSHLIRHLRLKYHFKVSKSDLEEVSSLYLATSK